MASLAQRRLGNKNLQVGTKPDQSKQRTIQSLKDGVFQEKYSIHEKVMDSTHSHMEIRYATRKVDNLKVVVKLRYKPGCFKGETEEREWRQSTEFMLNVPTCEGIAQLYEVCEDKKAFYIVTELAKGMDLFEVLHSKKGESFSANGVREIMKPMLEAIAHMHANSGVHKDLKLENVVVDVGNGKVLAPAWSPKSVKIIDFDTVEEWTPMSPKAKDVLGTDQYIAQESYDGTYSPCSDIFALGVIMYKLATGKFPFNDEIFDDQPGENYVGSAKMKQIRRRLERAKIDWTKECFVKNPSLADLCSHMLAYEVTDRPSAKDALMSEFFGGPGLPTKSSP
jgi:serine/threonine protein kinase